MTRDMTPPPLKSFYAVVESPELPRRYEYAVVEARTPVEAEVIAAENALAQAGDDLPRALRGLSQEARVVAVAKYTNVSGHDDKENA